MDGITKLAAALVAAQKDLTNPKFDKQNPHYHSKYASLAGIIDTVRPALLKHGLAVVQPIETGTLPGTISVHTILIHTSGESIKSTQSRPRQGTRKSWGAWSPTCGAMDFPRCSCWQGTTTMMRTPPRHQPRRPSNRLSAT